jgi:phospholipase/carboxylesterase
MPTLSLFHRVRPSALTLTPPPVLVLFHGNRGTEQAIHALWEAFDPRWLILSPRAPYQGGPDEYTWLDFAGPPTPDRLPAAHQAFQAATDIVFSFLAEAQTAYGGDPNRLYVCGHSQGAAVSGTLGLLYQAPLAGAVMLCGSLWPPTLDYLTTTEHLVGRTFLVGHGSQDRYAPPAMGAANCQLLRHLPVHVTYQEYDMAHDINAACFKQVTGWLSQQLTHAAGSGDRGCAEPGQTRD